MINEAEKKLILQALTTHKRALLELYKVAGSQAIKEDVIACEALLDKLTNN